MEVTVELCELTCLCVKCQRAVHSTIFLRLLCRTNDHLRQSSSLPRNTSPEKKSTVGSVPFAFSAAEAGGFMIPIFWFVGPHWGNGSLLLLLSAVVVSRSLHRHSDTDKKHVTFMEDDATVIHTLMYDGDVKVMYWCC